MNNNRFTLLAAVALISVASAGLAPEPVVADDEVPTGQTALVENKCNMCHAIEAAGVERTSKSDKMKGADLSTVGDEPDVAWIV